MATKVSLSEARIEQLDVEGAVVYAVNFIADLGSQWFDLLPIPPAVPKVSVSRRNYLRPKNRFWNR